MLFSQPDVASYINQNFEPVWKSLRPVPKVSIDFGNGKVIKRTLHGNIATYVCTADGAVIDVLPGLYDKKAYIAELDKLAFIAAQLPFDAPGRANALAAYHDAARGANYAESSNAITHDTNFNESVRRDLIHERLSAIRNARFRDINPWLYREVLHADLADPYLGLGPTLFASYPFKDSTAAQ